MNWPEAVAYLGGFAFLSVVAWAANRVPRAHDKDSPYETWHRRHEAPDHLMWTTSKTIHPQAIEDWKKRKGAANVPSEEGGADVDGSVHPHRGDSGS